VRNIKTREKELVRKNTKDFDFFGAPLLIFVRIASATACNLSRDGKNPFSLTSSLNFVGLSYLLATSYAVFIALRAQG
jgi:hypothetical protein